MSVNENAYLVYEELKSLLSFGPEDSQNLTTLKEVLGPKVPEITANFYKALLSHEPTAKFIEGRVETLQKTHIAWFMDVLGGEYGRDFFERQFTIGLVHVRIALPPHYVEGIMSYIRAESLTAITSLVDDNEKASRLASSLIKILDINLAVINLSYHEIRLDKLTQATGMKRPLLENLILHG